MMAQYEVVLKHFSMIEKIERFGIQLSPFFLSVLNGCTIYLLV